MIAAIEDRVRSVTTAVARVTMPTLLVRAGIWTGGFVGFALALPPDLLLSRLGGMLAVLSAAPALFPRRFWPTTVLLLTVGAWLAGTRVGEQVTLWRLLVLAVVLYLTHSLCALAAVLPYDLVVESEPLSRWLLRSLVVAVGAAVLSVLLLATAGSTGDEQYLLAALGGLAVALAVAALLGWLLRRGDG